MSYGMVVIGGSKGGMRALQVVLGTLPAGFPLPVAVALHREKGSGEELAVLLQKTTPLVVVEPDDKETILPGRIYLAPPDYHLLVDGSHFALSIDELVEYARPSLDVLFESAVEVFREKLIGVILTGENQDGARGLAAVKARGGLTVVQDPATAEAPSMPAAAIAAVPGATILSPEAIGPFLAEQCVKSETGARRQAPGSRKREAGSRRQDGRR